MTLYLLAALIAAIVLIVLMIRKWKIVLPVTIIVALFVVAFFYTYPWSFIENGPTKEIMEKIHEQTLDYQARIKGRITRMIPGYMPFPEFTGTIAFSEEETVVEDDNGLFQLVLPPALSEEEIEFSIKAIDGGTITNMDLFPEGVDTVQVFEVYLGDMHELPGVAEMTMPYRNQRVPDGTSPQEYISAMSYNDQSKEWEYAYYTVDEANNKVTIKTTHFSNFAITYGDTHLANKVNDLEAGEIAKELRISAAGEAPDPKSALYLGWSEVNNYMGFVGQGAGFPEELTKQMGFLANSNLEKLNKGLTQYGYAAIFIQYFHDIATVETDHQKAKAAFTSTRNAVSYGISKYAFSALKIASIGTFFIDYSLNAFVEAAFQGSEDAYYKMYEQYYGGKDMGAKSRIYWRDRLLEVVRNPENEDIWVAVDELATDYLYTIWDDEGALAILMQENDKLGFGGLNEDMKDRLMAKYKPWFYESRIIPAMEMVEEIYLEQTKLERQVEVARLEKELTIAYMIEVAFKLPRDVEEFDSSKVKMIFADDEGQVFVTSEDVEAKRNEIGVRHSALDYYIYNESHRLYYSLFDVIQTQVMPSQVIVEIPLADGDVHREVLALAQTLESNHFLSVTVPDGALEELEDDVAVVEENNTEPEGEIIEVDMILDDEANDLEGEEELAVVASYVEWENGIRSTVASSLDQFTSIDTSQFDVRKTDYASQYTKDLVNGETLFFSESTPTDHGITRFEYQKGKEGAFDRIWGQKDALGKIIDIQFNLASGVTGAGFYKEEIDGFLYTKITDRNPGGLGFKKTIEYNNIVLMRIGLETNGMYEVFAYVHYDPKTNLAVRVDISEDGQSFGNFSGQ